jgi:hypothetical protein
MRLDFWIASGRVQSRSARSVLPESASDIAAAHITLRRVVVTHFALRRPAQPERQAEAGLGFRISPSVASVVLCWLRSRQHP